MSGVKAISPALSETLRALVELEPERGTCTVRLRFRDPDAARRFHDIIVAERLAEAGGAGRQFEEGEIS